MTGDPIWTGLLLVAVPVFSIVALFPSWVIRVLSFGTQTVDDVSRRLVVTTRMLAAVGAIWGAIYLVVGFIRG